MSDDPLSAGAMLRTWFERYGIVIDASRPEVIEAVDKGQLDPRLVPFPPDAKAIEPGDYIADWSKARRVLGWTPEVGLEEGLGRTLAYYAEHREHYW